MNSSKIAVRVDGALTYQKILETAGAKFAEVGFVAATNKSIALAAQVDLASINYHFKNRKGLYQQVLIEAHRHIVSLDALLAITKQTASAEEQLKAVIVLFTKGLQQQQSWHYQVLAREVLAPSESLMVLMDEELAPKLSVMKTILSEISGIPVAAANLLPCLINVVAPCLMLLVGKDRIPGPTAQVIEMSSKVLVEQLHCFAVAGLKAVGKQYHAMHAAG